MNVGDVLFLYTEIKGKRTILPVRIHEKIVRESINQTTEQYQVEFPGGDELVLLTDLNKLGQVFQTLEDAEESLLQAAKNEIKTIVNHASALQEQCYGPAKKITDTLEIPEQPVESFDS